LVLLPLFWDIFGTRGYLLAIAKSRLSAAALSCQLSAIS